MGYKRQDTRAAPPVGRDQDFCEQCEALIPCDAVARGERVCSPACRKEFLAEAERSRIRPDKRTLLRREIRLTPSF